MGFPLPAAEYSENRIDLNELIKHPVSTYFFQVDNDVMRTAHIPRGARLVVDRPVRPTDGSIVVAVSDGEYVVRRLRLRGTQRMLLSDSDQVRPIYISEEGTDVWGVVTYILINAKEV